MFKKSFIEAQISNGGREDIIRFIANVRFHCGYTGQDIIRRLFRQGYCYYFACILKRAFNGGSIICLPDAKHFVYKIDDVLYDIEGVYEVDLDTKMINENDMGTKMSSYLHNDFSDISMENNSNIQSNDWKSCQHFVYMQE